MSFAFAAAAKAYQAAFDQGGDLGTGPHTEVPWPTARPTVPPIQVDTDGLDPAAPGGPSPMNSGQGPYGTPVASDPLLQAPIQPGAPIPHVEGPDLDTTTLR
jgi:hypothetical protein